MIRENWWFSAVKQFYWENSSRFMASFTPFGTHQFVLNCRRQTFTEKEWDGIRAPIRIRHTNGGFGKGRQLKGIRSDGIQTEVDDLFGGILDSIFTLRILQEKLYWSWLVVVFCLFVCRSAALTKRTLSCWPKNGMVAERHSQSVSHRPARSRASSQWELLIESRQVRFRFQKFDFQNLELLCCWVALLAFRNSLLRIGGLLEIPIWRDANLERPPNGVWRLKSGKECLFN